MKFGKPEKHIRVNINPADFAEYHLDYGCEGEFRVVSEPNGVYASSALGPIQVQDMMFVECESCGSKLIAPRFDELIETLLAETLILTPKLLSPKQLKFLRQFFDLTQEDVARFFDSDKFQISKYESAKVNAPMPPERQAVLKMRYAEIFGITEPEKLYNMHHIVEDYEDVSHFKVPTNAWDSHLGGLRMA